jgi:hypothetical protein
VTEIACPSHIWKIVNGQWAASVNPGASPAGFAIAATGDTNHRRHGRTVMAGVIFFRKSDT